MAIRPFLAMTAAELRNCGTIPEQICWMACHFSPYGLGLSNLPRTLPPGSVLILDDITPIRGHSPEIIAVQLLQCVQALDCSGILLDFQRPDVTGTAALAKHLVQTLPCPVAVSEIYADGLDCPVFLSAPPCCVPLKEHIVPFRGREIWLELAMNAERLFLSPNGTEICPLPLCQDAGGFPEEHLHCHYRAESEDDCAKFTLWRTWEDLQSLLEEAASLGIGTAVGLYQELGNP